MKVVRPVKPVVPLTAPVLTPTCAAQAGGFDVVFAGPSPQATNFVVPVAALKLAPPVPVNVYVPLTQPA